MLSLWEILRRRRHDYLPAQEVGLKVIKTRRKGNLRQYKRSFPARNAGRIFIRTYELYDLALTYQYNEHFMTARRIFWFMVCYIIMVFINSL